MNIRVPNCFTLPRLTIRLPSLSVYSSIALLVIKTSKDSCPKRFNVYLVQIKIVHVRNKI